jgi:hypothetical protein
LAAGIETVSPAIDSESIPPLGLIDRFGNAVDEAIGIESNVIAPPAGMIAGRVGHDDGVDTRAAGGDGVGRAG